jgi:hypothetical protein
MTLTQTKPATCNQPQIWKEATAQAEIGDVIRKPYCPIARVVGKENLKDGRVCLIVVFPAWGDRHTEEWVIPTAPAATTAPTATEPTAVAKPEPVEPTATVATKKLKGCRQYRHPWGETKVEPTATVATKKLMLTLVSVKRLTSDISASNFDQFELEIAGELSLAIDGFIIPPVLVRDSSGYRVVSGHFQYHAAVLARRLNPKAGETIPAIVLEAENQSAVLAQLGILKLRAA